jgi:flagellar biosynthesis protein FlhF
MPPTPAAAGSCYRFVVASADEAATVIRDRLGADARVLSVRTLPAGGILGLFSAPRIEVVAHVPAPEPAPEPEPAPAPAPEAAAPAVDPRVRAARERWREPAGDLAGLLARSGFSPLLLARLQQDPSWGRLAALPLHRALADTGRLLRYWTERPGSLPLSRAAFLGSPGVGRTTALCKWLGAEVFQRGRFGHVVTAEFDRPLAPGPLPVFCEALGVPVAHYPAATRPATPGGFVYFDLPGISLARPADNAAIARFLDEEAVAQRVLVLNAAYDSAALRAAYAAGRELGATHVVFTHLDEVPQWGRLWDYLLDGELEPLFLATGPSLTGDLETDPGEALARRTLPAGAPPPAAATALDSAA